MRETVVVKKKDASFFPNPQAIWRRLPHPMGCDEYASVYHYNGLNVIVSAEIKSDGLEWLHVSFSRTSRIPDYKDKQMVKRDFIGNDKKAIMVFPDEDHYVNNHPYCLHLWYSADNPLPEFSTMIGGTRHV